MNPSAPDRPARTIQGDAKHIQEVVSAMPAYRKLVALAEAGETPNYLTVCRVLSERVAYCTIHDPDSECESRTFSSMSQKICRNFC